MTARNTALIGLSPLMGDTNTSTVTTPNGMAAYRRNGMRRPSLCLQRSESDAIHGSVTASNRRPRAVMPPMIVSIPKKTADCAMKIVWPWLKSESSGM